MSDTPETDKLLADWMKGRSEKIPDFAALARRLERERDEARFLLKAAQSTLDAIHLDVGGWIKIMKENTD
jgi:hypothetical protein